MLGKPDSPVPNCGVVVHDPNQLAFEQHIFPIFTVDPAQAEGGSKPTLDAFLGTGFLLSGGIFLTAWHVVEQALILVALSVSCSRSTGRVSLNADYAPIHAFATDEHQTDLAIGYVRRLGGPGLELTRVQAAPGEDVCTWGFPLMPPPQRREHDGAKVFGDMAPRYLQGYITRTAAVERPDGTAPAVIEMDMPAPAGVSGAPLLRKGRGEVIGVIIGESVTEQADGRGRSPKRFGQNRFGMPRRLPYRVGT
jgi:hypothetical protein